MKIAIIGTTGRVGTYLIDEALRRGHQVMAITHTAPKLPAYAGLTTKDVDVADEARLVVTPAGNDVVYSTIRFPQAGVDQTIDAVEKATAPRLPVMDGTDGLEVTPGVALIDMPQSPKEYPEEASTDCDFLNVLYEEAKLNWVFMSLSTISEPNERTRCLRVGKDLLLVDVSGRLWTSTGNYAIVFLDEMEEPAYPHWRFTVGY